MEGTLAAPNSASLIIVGCRVLLPARVGPAPAPADARTLALTMQWTDRGWQTRVNQCEGPVGVIACDLSPASGHRCQKPSTPVPAWELPPGWPSKYTCFPIPRRPKFTCPRGGVRLAGAASTPQCEPAGP